MHIETSLQKIVQLLVKGDDYDVLCPKNEDTWYNAEEALSNKRLQSLLSTGTLYALQKGSIDFIVVRGNW